MSARDNDDAAVLLRGVLSLGRRLRAERPRGGVSLSGIGLLSTLHAQGPMPAARLAKQEGLQAQSLTRLISGLERMGCIERRRSETDRREIVVMLTPRGREVLAEDMRGRQRWLERAMAEALTGAERETLLQAAAAMLRLARHQAAGDTDPLGPP
ncbi:MarR family transcriptional regulator [Rhodovastum atsumiense]|uniref:MarR family transcriptional regulator n=1 Tax=Rhodovastum atsumiense TaxID=504468 RepID=A0A5M6ILW6_9PROT|nr:MarR family transcriptional regulator [Rhodovastum atsumiense]KAA5609254.1 MarR family transcriptional regulator [Rhodovastum atsumiense]CAH2601707.1 MarR family transcriptional regulator [Rhodovastum atsumiense]